MHQTQHDIFIFKQTSLTKIETNKLYAKQQYWKPNYGKQLMEWSKVGILASSWSIKGVWAPIF